MNHGSFFLRQASRLSLSSIARACMALSLAISAAPSQGAVTSRHYDFEQGAAGGVTSSAADIITNQFLVGTGPRAGFLWVEVPGPSPRPLPAGNLQDSVSSVALTAPAMQAVLGTASYANVANGSPLDSPAIGSQLALQFNGNAYFDDFNTAPGARGVFVNEADYLANLPLDPGVNGFENFSLITQAWVRPNSAGMGTYQTVYQTGTEQGSVNITTDGFWEAAELGSVGILTTTVPVAFDQWTHVGIFRGGNGAEFYINGVLAAGNRNPDPPNFFNTFAGVISIGGDDFGATPFNGLIDDFKVMGTADGVVDPRIDMDYWDRVIRCDFNNDTTCTIADLNAMLQQGPIASGPLVTPGQNQLYDLNEDGRIDLADRDAWLADAATQNGLGSPYKLGDANLDGVVDGSDFGIWNSNKFTSALNWDQGDFNQDGVVDGSDFGIWNGNKFTASDASVVPEPVAVPLLAISLLGIVLRARRSAR